MEDDRSLQQAPLDNEDSPVRDDSNEAPLLQPILEALHEIRLFLLAGIEQQREVVKYMNRLDQWLQLDAKERRDDSRSIPAEIDGTYQHARRQNTPAQGDPEVGRFVPQQMEMASEVHSPREPDRIPQGTVHPATASSYAQEQLPSHPSYSTSKKPLSSIKEEANEGVPFSESLPSRHVAFQSLPTISNTESQTVVASSPIYPQASPGSTSVTVSMGQKVDERTNPEFKIDFHHGSPGTQQAQYQTWPTMSHGVQYQGIPHPGPALPYQYQPFLPQFPGQPPMAWAGSPPSYPMAPTIVYSRPPSPSPPTVVHSGYTTRSLPIVPSMDGRFFASQVGGPVVVPSQAPTPIVIQPSKNSSSSRGRSRTPRIARTGHSRSRSRTPPVNRLRDRPRHRAYRVSSNTSSTPERMAPFASRDPRKPERIPPQRRSWWKRIGGLGG